MPVSTITCTDTRRWHATAIRDRSSTAAVLQTVSTHSWRIASSNLYRWRPRKAFSMGRKTMTGTRISGRAAASSMLATAIESTAGASD